MLIAYSYSLNHLGENGTFMSYRLVVFVFLEE